MKTVIGVWCGAGSKLTAQVHGLPIWKRVVQRIPAAHALIPWTQDLDWMEDELRGWRPTRCHPDALIAVRDLVVTMGAEAGALIQGDCLAIDREEIALAFAAIEHGLGARRGGATPVIEGAGAFYASPRVQAFHARDWIRAFDTDEWGPYPISVEDIRTLSPKQLEMRWARIKGSREP